ncbi:Lnb N-terminal periplasmic domain-containing protein [Alkalimarinus alittae]|uniref:DUF4105 domain-containing protein n=1 Tax=Alkalimarinus alittae TaxID=2961619 RepID=A0ABY6N415_9ALTE|nr:DUF4105 domain-containing protein [Alkalimarinus alittae]UZE96860.1 DUF4105 domain-containing protein [Alkalimarinus alittae]
MHFFRLLFSLSLIGGLSGYALAETQADDRAGYAHSVKQKAAMLKLSEDDTWRKLLHYRRDYFSGTGVSSYVDDATFFYAPDGHFNAENELQSTIDAFFISEDLDGQHAQCRFVYRFKWISEQLALDSEKLPAVRCTEYIEWREQVNAHSVSLIFPATALNSPSSMFGHTLLRFDPKDIEGGSDWLSYALNFGANINNDDNSISFAFRGLAGGYPGVYNMMRYFEKIKEYNRMENRDIWEYKLNYTPEEVDLILTHVWELKNINFDYYFFDENCAFRLLELLELVRPEVNLTERFKLDAIPTNTVRAVVDEGLVESTYFRPSELAELHARIESLPKDIQRLGKALSNDIDVMNTPEFEALNQAQKGEVVQIAYSYLRYIQLQTQRDEAMAKRSYQLLLALNKLSSKKVVVDRPDAPETGHKTITAGVSVGERNDEVFQQINYRVTYHDLLDNQKGYLRGAQIILFNTELRHYNNDGLKLNRFDLVDITSLSKRNLFLTPLSWKVQVGYERVYSRNEEVGVVQLNGGAGHSYELSDNVELFGLLTGRIEHNKQFNSILEPAIGVETGLLYYSPIGTQKVDFSGSQFLNDDYRMRAGFTQNFNLGVNHAVRVSLAQEWHNDDDFYDISIGYRYYF